VTAVPERLAASLADRYVVERELGAGGMATVFLAHDVRHDRKVALKVLRPELSAILGGERFLAEIKTTDVSRDGRSFLMISLDRQTADQPITVVLNWFAHVAAAGRGAR
jgi:serine/threonine protein kinase